MSRMASQTRRISKTLLLTLLLVVMAIPVAIFFPRNARLKAWTPPSDMVVKGDTIQVEFGESKTGAIPLLVIEVGPMDPKGRSRRHRMLYGKLAEAQLGPLRLALVEQQGRRAVSDLPARCHVVLELSLRDLILLARGPKDRRDSVVALWPLRRNGIPAESKLYDRIGAHLLHWKQKIEALQGKLLVLYLPQPIECDPEQLATELELLDLDSSQLQSSRAARRLQDLCKELHIPFVDPTRLLAGAGRKKRPLFDHVGAAPFQARYTERAENLILGRLTHQGIQLLLK